MQIFSSLAYYAKSLLTIISGFYNPISVLTYFLKKSNTGGSFVRQVRLKRSGLFFKVRTPMDVWSIKETFLDDFYRFSQYGNFKSGVVIDIGAGIGEFAIQAAAANPDCQVYGFEPYPESFSFFQQNIALNNLQNVTAVDSAVTSVPGMLVMDTSSGNPLQYRMQSDTASKRTNVNAIQSIGLMEFLDQHKIQTCDFLKLDCEGGEYDILLPLSKPDMQRFNTIVMEYHDSLTAHTHIEIVDRLTLAGFKVEVVANQVHADLGYVYAQLSDLSK